MNTEMVVRISVLKEFTSASKWTLPMVTEMVPHPLAGKSQGCDGSCNRFAELESPVVELISRFKETGRPQKLTGGPWPEILWVLWKEDEMETEKIEKVWKHWYPDSAQGTDWSEASHQLSIFCNNHHIAPGEVVVTSTRLQGSLYVINFVCYIKVK